MKILLVSYWFPPANAMAAVRLGKFAKYLYEAGHDVRVLVARSPEDPSLPVELPEDCIIRTPYWEVDRIFDPVSGALRRTAKRFGIGRRRTGTAAVPPGAMPSIAHPPVVAGLRRHYYAMIQVPDSRVGWRGYAVAAGRQLLARWRPDVIVASAPPFTCLLIARKLGREFGVPWVAEFRDIWVDNPYNTDPVWRQLIDRQIERRVLKDAAAVGTVTPVWSDVLEHQYCRPVFTILNGFAIEDVVPAAPPTGSDVVTIVYTGSIYPGYRDPSPLFAALARLGEARHKVEVIFYGAAADDVRPLAARHGVADRVFMRSRVSYRESLALQAAADILLLLQWNDAKDEGNMPGKFFEYIGALRPILLLGYERGIVAKMIRERNAGLASNAPDEIAAHLKRWIAQRPRGIPALDPAARRGLSRADQFREYEKLLLERFAPASSAVRTDAADPRRVGLPAAN